MKTALIVVDMLTDFIDPEGTLYCGDAARQIVPEVARMLETAREEGMPVFFLVDWHDPDDAEFAMFPEHCVRDTKGAEVIDELKPRQGEAVIRKKRFSGFFGTDLDLRLREKGVERVVLAGVATNICVLYTAADARMRHYKVTVPKNAVASFDQEAGRFALEQMTKVLGAQVVDSWPV